MFSQQIPVSVTLAIFREAEKKAVIKRQGLRALAPGPRDGGNMLSRR
jgi:hypothetical protein